jgi:hypothetical protein
MGIAGPQKFIEKGVEKGQYKGLESVGAPSSPSAFKHPSFEGAPVYAAVAALPSATGPGSVSSLE